MPMPPLPVHFTAANETMKGAKGSMFCVQAASQLRESTQHVAKLRDALTKSTKAAEGSETQAKELSAKLARSQTENKGLQGRVRTQDQFASALHANGWWFCVSVPSSFWGAVLGVQTYQLAC